MNPGLAGRYRSLLRVEMTPVALATGAFLVGLAGEALLFTHSWRVAGALLLAAAALASAFAWRGLRDLLVVSATPTAWGSRREITLRLAGIAASLGLFLGGLIAWWAEPGAVFGLQGVLWLGSIALLVASCRRWASGQDTEGQFPWTRGEIALFAAIVALSLFTHLAWLNDIPWRFTTDENTAYNEAMRFYRGPAISLFTTTWYGTGMPSMPVAISGWLMNLVGTGLAGVRASTAFFGALTVVPLYGLGRLLQGRTFAALAAFSWAVSAVGIHYSRVSLPNMLTPFAWTVCFYFLARGLRSSRPADFAWAGLFAGFSMYTYYAARLIPYLLVAFAIYLAIFHFPVFKTHIGHLGLTLVGFFVGFGPLLAYFIANPSVWAGRGLNELVIPAVIPTSWQQLAADVSTIMRLVWENFLGLSVIPSNDHVYFGSFLLPVEATLALIGTGVLLWRWKQPGSFLVLLWGGATLFVSGPLLAESVMPAYVHWVAAFPAVYLAIALPPALWLRSLESAAPATGDRRPVRARPRLLGRLVPSTNAPDIPDAPYSDELRSPVVGRRSSIIAFRILVAAGVIAIAVANGYYYLARYPATVPASFESAEGRFLATLNARDRVYFVGNSDIIYYPEESAMLAPQVMASELLNPSRELPLPPDPDHDLVFVFNNDETRYLPVIKGVYPGGESGPIDTPGGPVGMTYRIPAGIAVARSGALWPAPAATSEGLTVTWQGSSPGARVDPFVGASLFADDPGPVFGPYLRPGHERDPNFAPLAPIGTQEIIWQGEVRTGDGLYMMNLRTDGRAQLVIDGRMVMDLGDNKPVNYPDFFQGRFPGTNAEIKLGEGWHPVRLSLEPVGNLNGMEWSWTQPGGQQEIVPPWALRHK